MRCMSSVVTSVIFLIDELLKCWILHWFVLALWKRYNRLLWQLLPKNDVYRWLECAVSWNRTDTLANEYIECSGQSVSIHKNLVCRRHSTGTWFPCAFLWKFRALRTFTLCLQFDTFEYFCRALLFNGANGDDYDVDDDDNDDK